MGFWVLVEIKVQDWKSSQFFFFWGGRWSVPYTNKIGVLEGMRKKTRRIYGWWGVLGKEDEAWGCVGEGWFEVLWV